MTNLDNITSTDEGANYLPPFAVPMVRTVADCSPEIQQQVCWGGLCDWIWQLGVNRDRQLAQQEAETETPFAAGLTTPTFSPVQEISYMMNVNTRGTVAADSEYRPAGAKRVEHDYAAITMTHCHQVYATADYGVQYFEFMTTDGPVGLDTQRDRPELVQAATAYPLLMMKGGQKDRVDFNLTYQWIPGAGARSARRKLIEILPKGAEMPKTAVADPTSEDLTKIFPRDENNQPVEETPVLPWGDQNDKRGTFFARYEKEVWAPRKCPKEQAEVIRKRVLHDDYGTDTLKGFNGDVEELLRKLTSAVEAEYPLAMAYFDEPVKDKSISDKPETKADNAPQSSNRALPEDRQQNGPGPIRDEKAGPVNDTRTAVPQEPVTVKAAQSSAWTEVRINGHNIVVTAYHGQTGQQVADNVFALLEGLRIIAKDERVKEYAPVIDGRDQARPMKAGGEFVTSQPATAQQPASDTEGGKAPCALIKVALSYEGAKPQLQFECDGLDDPLRYTRGKSDMVKLLSKVRKSDGTAFTDADLEIGRKFGGAWLVRWEKNEKDGKMYRNVMAVEPVAA